MSRAAKPTTLKPNNSAQTTEQNMPQAEHKAEKVEDNLTQEQVQNQAQVQAQDQNNKQAAKELNQEKPSTADVERLVASITSQYPSLLFGKDDPMATVFVANKILIDSFSERLNLDKEKYAQDIQKIISTLAQNHQNVSQELESKIKQATKDINKQFEIESSTFSKFIQGQILPRTADIINDAFDLASKNMHKLALDKANNELKELKNTVIELTKNEYQNISRASKKIKTAAVLNLIASFLTMTTISIIIYLVLFAK